MYSIATILKNWFANSFSATVVITAVEILSATSFKLTYDCSSNPYPFVSMVLTVTHGVTEHLFTVTAVGECDFTVTGTYTPVVGDTFEMATPTFVHGTQKKAKPEIDLLMKAQNLNYPLIYLQEIQTEEFTNDPESAILSEPPIRLWLLLPSDVKDWITDYHYEMCIEAMRAFAKNIIEQFEYTNLVAERTPYNLVYHANVGTQSDTGHLKELLNQNHSGVLMLTTLKINREQCCC